MSQRRCYHCGGKIALRYKHVDSYQQRLGKKRLVTDSNGMFAAVKFDQTHLFCCTSCANWWLICRGMADRWNGIWTSETRHPSKTGEPKLIMKHRYPYYMDDEEYNRVKQLWGLV